MVGDRRSSIGTGIEVVEESFDQVHLLVRDQIVDAVGGGRRKGDLGV